MSAHALELEPRECQACSTDLGEIPGYTMSRHLQAKPLLESEACNLALVVGSFALGNRQSHLGTVVQ